MNRFGCPDFFLVGLTSVLACFGPLIVRRFVALEKLTTNNEVAGFKFATVGVLYAVLLAFAIILVWEKYADADNTVEKEAGAAAALYHISSGLESNEASALKIALTAYLRSAVSNEWPAMEGGEESKKTHTALEALYNTVSMSAKSQGGNPVASEIFRQIDDLTQARRARLEAAEGAVPSVVWGGPPSWRSLDDQLHIFLWHYQFAGADAYDRATFGTDIFRAFGRRSLGPPIFGNRESHAGRHRGGRSGPCGILRLIALSPCPLTKAARATQR